MISQLCPTPISVPLHNAKWQPLQTLGIQKYSLNKVSVHCQHLHEALQVTSTWDGLCLFTAHHSCLVKCLGLRPIFLVGLMTQLLVGQS